MARRAAVEKSADEQIQILLNVLRLEAKYGFNNSAVTGGGLDMMWPSLHRIAPAVRELAPMRDGRYSTLTIAERRSWANAAQRVLSGYVASNIEPLSEPPPRNPSKTAREITLDSPIDSLRSIHYRSRESLKELGIATIRDALWHFPIRHVDYSRRTPISHLAYGMEATVAADIQYSERLRFGRRRRAARVRVKDETGFLTITWFNMPYMADRWSVGDRIVVSGKVGEYRARPTMENPEYDDLIRKGKEVSSPPIHAGAIVPVYPSTEGANQRSIRSAIKLTLDKGLRLIDDPVPAEVRNLNRLMPLDAAVKRMHYPNPVEQYQIAVRRLAFDEFLYNQVAALRRRAAWKSSTAAPKIALDLETVNAYLKSLEFDLTSDQSDALRSILDDIGSGEPMARLLQGEVGSGKTVVAIAAMLSVSGDATRWQAALIAPTEVLAEQHFLNALEQLRCQPLFGATGPVYESKLVRSEDSRLRVALLIGSLKQSDKEMVQAMCASGEVDLIIGTHALLQERVDFHNLALAVVDEQQRFGTEQRAVLTNRTPRPHLLAMSATPIPRTLHMTLYGELDISVLKELPHGRKEIETRWAQTPADEAHAYHEIHRQVAQGRQAFIVCPLIDPSENIPGASAIVEFERLSGGDLHGLNLGLLHGRMSLSEKQSIMDDFRSGRTDVLVATPVIEVGVDIPNATVMLIKTAEQFGLSQLHQIRGRVGRGEHPGLCVLVSDSDSETARERIQSLVDSADGFGLAAKDLSMRGPGRNLERAQSGWSGWRFARFDDLKLLRQARSAAEQLLRDDPGLRHHPVLRREVIRSVGKAPAAFA